MIGVVSASEACETDWLSSLWLLEFFFVTGDFSMGLMLMSLTLTLRFVVLGDEPIFGLAKLLTFMVGVSSVVALVRDLLVGDLKFSFSSEKRF